MTNLNGTHRKLQHDLAFFSRHALKIKDKSGAIVPFEFNSAQQYLHKQIEEQYSETGRVRIIIVKGRQQGCSTYTAARYYHKATRQRGKSVFILSHEAKTTDKLFAMVERFQHKIPDPLRPTLKVANRRELKFLDIESDYAVGTAGNEDVGRGGTVQYFHGSEVAFWERTDAIETGIMQSVADMPDTEVILESTANGMGNMFYRRTMSAIDGNSDYRVVFIPWYWQTEYRRKVPHNGVVQISEEEADYQRLYGVELEQLYWRRAKIAELGTLWKFKQEYPSYLQEAFQTSGETLISAERIMAARHSALTDKHSPLVMGVDPGRSGDRTVFAYRRGREISKPEVLRFEKTDNAQMVIAGMVAKRIKERNPQKVFIDVGHGYGTIDRLKELGFGDVVEGVHFGATPVEPEIYINKRAEMWCLLRDWLHGEDGEVSIPDQDDIQKDLMSMPQETVTSSGKTQFPTKDNIKKKLGMSPDIGDAFALTFAYPVMTRRPPGQSRIVRKKDAGSRHSLAALRRMDRRPIILHN